MADLFRRMGFNVDLVSTDWGTPVARRASRASIRGHNENAWPGWPTIPAMEAQRDIWFDGPNGPAALAATTETQRIAFDGVPYVPTGFYNQPTAYRLNLTGMLKGQPPLFRNIRRAWCAPSETGRFPMHFAMA